MMVGSTEMGGRVVIVPASKTEGHRFESQKKGQIWTRMPFCHCAINFI
jgi:hypothetical protein